VAASQARENHDAERSGGDPVLTAERDQLGRSREFLRLMREDVMSLKAMGGDPVSEEYLKADLYHRAEALKDIPDAPLFFGRLDYASQHGASQHGASQHGASPEPDSPGLEIPELEYPEPDSPTMASRGTAFTSAEGTCTRRTARPP
jgi:hypothetical protein